MKTSPLQTILLVAMLFVFAGCASDGGIPVDEKLARVHVIPIKEAREYVRSFERGRVELSRQVKDSAFLRDSFNLPIAEMFNRHSIALLLNVEGAEGVRIYLGRDAKGEVRLVLLPVDKNGNNIITRLIPTSTVSIPGISSAYADGDEGEAIENGQRCPTLCGVSW